MAVQLHVVYSKVFMGNGIMAGGELIFNVNAFLLPWPHVFFS